MSDTAWVEIILGTLTNTCFVIMPFTPSYADVYQRVIKPAVEETDITCIRADEIYSKPHIMADIWKSLRSSRIVIAELTDKNPNVLYELGLAHALGKPTIIITRNSDDVPFDLQSLRYLHYNIEDPFWGGNLNTALTSMVKQVLGEESYGTVFENITIKGDVTPEDVEPESEDEFIDLSGKWKGRMDFKDQVYELELDIVQLNNSLEGTMIVEFVSDNETSKIKQTMKGQIEHEDVTLYGTTVSYIVEGASSGYNTDNFSLKLSENNEILEGSVTSKASEGSATLKKI